MLIMRNLNLNRVQPRTYDTYGKFNYLLENLDQNYIVEQSFAETVYSAKNSLQNCSVLLIDGTLLCEAMLSRSRKKIYPFFYKWKKKCHALFFKPFVPVRCF